VNNTEKKIGNGNYTFSTIAVRNDYVRIVVVVNDVQKKGGAA
jgi:hypothetical protein